MLDKQKLPEEKTIIHMQLCGHCSRDTPFSSRVINDTLQIDTCLECGRETTLDFECYRQLAKTLKVVPERDKL